MLVKFGYYCTYFEFYFPPIADSLEIIIYLVACPLTRAWHFLTCMFFRFSFLEANLRCSLSILLLTALYLELGELYLSISFRVLTLTLLLVFWSTNITKIFPASDNYCVIFFYSYSLILVWWTCFLFIQYLSVWFWFMSFLQRSIL